MEEQRNWQDQYNNYDGYDRDCPFTPEQPSMDKEIDDNTTKMLAL